jgi:hypothetical protein
MGIRSIIRAPADRFHLWQNLGQAVEKTVNATVLTSANGRRTARRDPAAGAAVPGGEEDRHPDARELRRSPALACPGPAQDGDRAETGLAPGPSANSPTARSADDLIAKTEQRIHLVDPWTAHLHQRWHEGERNATQLFRDRHRPGPLDDAAETGPQRFRRHLR